MIPYRLVCYHLASCTNETYSAAGISKRLIYPLLFIKGLNAASTSKMKRMILLSLIFFDAGTVTDIEPFNCTIISVLVVILLPGLA